MAANVGKDLSLQAELADSLTIGTGLLRSTGGGELDLSKESQISLALVNIKVKHVYSACISS